MRYYLDTNLLIFIITQNQDEINPKVAEILTDYVNTFYVSLAAILFSVFQWSFPHILFKQSIEI